MILRRSTIRRVPSALIRTRSSSQPPCSARSTSIRVTTLRECSRENSQLVELPLDPRPAGAASDGSRGSPRQSPETSSSASTISSGRDGPRRPSAPSSWAAVRAPTIGAVTPGRSRTQASATSSGVQPRPSAAWRPPRRSAAAVVEVAARRSWRSAGRRRGSPTGVPVRYLPVSTPRPSGDQGSTPRPSARGRRQDLVLDPAVQQGVLDLGRGQRRPARAPRAARSPPGRSASRRSWRRRRTPPGRSRRRSRARESVSSSGVSSAQTCTCQRSTWSTPSRFSDASSWRAGGRGRCWAPRPPRRREMPALVARTTSSRATTSPSREPMQLLGARRRRSRRRCRRGCRRPRRRR